MIGSEKNFGGQEIIKKDKMVAEKPKKMKNSCGTKQHGNRKLENLPVTKNVMKIMQKDNLDKKTVARGMGISEQEFDYLLNGNDIITASDILQLCMVLGVDANTLFEGGRYA